MHTQGSKGCTLKARVRREVTTFRSAIASVCFGEKGPASVREMDYNVIAPVISCFKTNRTDPLLSSSSFSLVLQTKAKKVERVWEIFSLLS